MDELVILTLSKIQAKVEIAAILIVPPAKEKVFAKEVSVMEINEAWILIKPP